MVMKRTLIVRPCHKVDDVINTSSVSFLRKESTKTVCTIYVSSKRWYFLDTSNSSLWTKIFSTFAMEIYAF